MTNLHRDKKHHHYWVFEGILRESYRRIRGMRWRSLAVLPTEFKDTDMCDKNYIEKVERHLNTPPDIQWENEKFKCVNCKIITTLSAIRKNGDNCPACDGIVFRVTGRIQVTPAIQGSDEK